MPEGHYTDMSDVYPLSPLQEGILFHSELESGSDVYLVQTVFDINGTVNSWALQRAWQQLVDRHPILRTAFVWEGLSQPLQVVGRTAAIPWQTLNWCDVSPEDQEFQFQRLLESDRRHPFDLNEAPLARVCLVSLQSSLHKMIFSHHHLILDGWSLQILSQELLQCYKASCLDRPVSLPPSRPYRDYISWLAMQDQESAEDYWKHYLSSFTSPTLVARTRRPESASPQATFDRHRITLSQTTTRELNALVRKKRVTLNTLAQGAWAILLSRYLDVNDVMFGATVSGRPVDLAGSDSMVGLFINVLPVRVRVPGESQAWPWLAELQAQLADARQYEFTSLVKMHEWSEVPPGVPLFDSVVVIGNYPWLEEDASLRDSVSIERVDTFEHSNVPLALEVDPGSELSIEVVFDRRYFSPRDGARFLSHFENILLALLESPVARISELPLLTEAERYQLLVDWNATTADYPRDQCIHQLFEAQAARTPEAVAVEFGEERLTYRELDARANQLAHYLRTLGPRPGELVGICISRSLGMVVAVLGVFKAGFAYVPLDPAYPIARLEYMLADSKASMLLIERPQIDKFSKFSGLIAFIDDALSTNGQTASADAERLADPENLAYVIYTSGSEGRPKGVLTTHRSVVNYLSYLSATYCCDRIDTVLQLASLSFDASTRDIWTPLLAGAKLIIVREEQSKDPYALLDTIRARNVTCVLSIVPSLLRALVGAAESRGDTYQSVRLLLVSGESLYASDVARAQSIFQNGLSKALIVNQYGPTECTMTSTYYAIQEGQAEEGEVPIGRPVPNTRIYVLDRQLQPVPVGVGGEAYIGGEGVTWGYLNQPRLTAERFVPDPFGEHGRRLYRTGDLVRWKDDNLLEFLGRLDNQIKVRGYRIELGEVEKTLAAHPAIAQAVVIAQETSLEEGNRLVAYFVTDSDVPVSTAELRDFLATHLPDYMVPATFVPLAVLPLSPNGKVDRKALPFPEITAAAQATPLSPTEELVAAIWADLLGLARIGVHDDFFDLGGNSLLAMVLVARAREATQVEVPLVYLFEEPTVAGFARRIDEGTGSELSPTLQEIMPIPR